MSKLQGDYVFRDIVATMYPSRLCRVMNGQFQAPCAITGRRVNKLGSITRHSLGRS